MVIHDVYTTLQRLKYVKVGVAFTVRPVPVSTDETVVNITSELIEYINLSGNQLFPDLFFFSKTGSRTLRSFTRTKDFCPGRIGVLTRTDKL